MSAINKAAANGLGAWSLLSDKGVTMELTVYTDASTGKSLATRRGLGNICHMSVNELCIQELVRNNSVTIVNIKNKFNPSEMSTKYLSKAKVETIMEHVQHFFEQGRAAAAPKLALPDEKPMHHDNELHVATHEGYQICYCRGYEMSM